jgi:XTP/dITP diphosphohydrolase
LASGRRLLRAQPQPLRAAAPGRLLRLEAAARGERGFGYDPYFLVPEFGKTGAELGEDEKNAISHRGQALRELADKLKQLG